ncbi:MAG: TonB-dependent receptor [Acidimicrobiia bacterium]|nr:TonB-dependent receptor [Acidimicrobiia bacterium]
MDDLASLRLTPMPDAVSVIDPRHFAFAYLSSRATDLGFVGRFEATVWYNGHREARTFRRSGWERSVFDDDRLAATGVRLSATTVPYRRHTLSVAADAQAEGADSKRWEVRDDRSIWWQRGRFPVGTRSRLLAVSVADSWQVAETITLKGDLRFMARKIHSAYGPSVFGLSGLVGLVNRWYSGFSWETGLTKRFESGLSLSGSVSRGFRAPGLDDVVANASWRNGRDVPNPDLGSERATQLEIAGQFTGRHNTFGAAIFHTRYGDLIRRDWFEPGPDGLVATGEDLYQFRNLESASVSGGEVGMTTRFSTSWDVDVEVAGRAVMHWWHAAENAVPRYLPPVVARLGTRFSRGLIWVEPYAGFSSRSSAVQYTVAGAVSDESAAWITLNVRGGARAGERLAFAAAVENIGDVRYHEHGSYIRSPGRNLVLSVSYGF